MNKLKSHQPRPTGITHKTLIIAAFLFLPVLVSAQIRLQGYNEERINPDLFHGQWPASWISVPDEPADAYGVYHFRKSFELDSVPQKFVIHVSADNRYKLFVNGRQAAFGPARGDIFNWNFETVDIAPLLRAGRNTLAAVVWNYADKRPLAQISFGRTELIVEADSDSERPANTDDSWLCIRNTAYRPWERPVCGYYVCGPGEQIDSREYPWGWESPGFDDSGWKKARPGMKGATKGSSDYPGRLLVPSPIPSSELKKERFETVALCEGITLPGEFPERKTAINIPANSRVRIVLDRGHLMTGYSAIAWSGGRDAVLTLGYAEAYYTDTSSGNKANRNEVEGKVFLGYEDRITADGGAGRSFCPLWWRTWRYIDLHVETKAEPLTIDDLYGVFSAYPFEKASTFSAPGNPELEKMLEIGWRTARLCANETYMDCPYYEQLQYFGDTRIQAMVTLFNTRDGHMVKNALERGRQSMTADGLTMSRYPTYSHQFISSFSLWWICMGHDYWRYRGDEAYLKTQLPAYRNVLAWFEQWLKPDGSLDYVPYWFFADWADGFNRGEPIREKTGDSAFQDLLFAITLDAAAEMERAFGLPAMADHYAAISDRIKATADSKYWDASRGLYADTSRRGSYSQHVNALAVLSGVARGERAGQVMAAALEDGRLIKTTIYFSYYLNRALKKAGLGDRLPDNLGAWEEQLKLGLTTWAETPEPSRSDCHAWGSSPNIEFYRTVLGIDSDAPGFGKIRIEPSLGNLKKVSGTMPHPKGTIGADYTVDRHGKLTAVLSIPEGVEGTFVWKGREYPIVQSKQTFVIK